MGGLLPDGTRATHPGGRRMKPLSDCYLYGILDLGYVAQVNAVNVARELLAGGEGVDILQIRAKTLPAADLLDLARLVHPLTSAVGVPLILNDHPELVPAAGVEGAHIGQEDGLLVTARGAAGTGKIIGRSTHSPAQAGAARVEGADYLGFGPLFATATKPDYPPVGLENIARVHAAVPDRPIFCIGGVKEENLPAILAAGARRVAVVSALLLAKDAASYARRLKTRLLAGR